MPEQIHPVHSREHKEREIITLLAKDVTLVQNFMTRVQTLRHDEDVEASLDRVWDETLAETSPTARTRYENMLRKYSRYNQLERESRRIRQNDINRTVADIEFEASKSSDTGAAREAEMLFFLGNLRHKLHTKHAQVESFNGNIGDILLTLDDRGYILETSEIVSARWEDPWSVILTVEKEAFLKYVSKGNAAYIHDTPLCLIRSDLRDPEPTIRHERLHNFTYGILPTVNPAHILLGELRMVQQSSARLTPSAREHIAKRLQPGKYLDFLHGELVSAAEQAASEGFVRDATAEQRLLLAMRGITPENGTDMERYSRTLRTAGTHTLQLIEEVRKYAAEPQIARTELEEKLRAFETSITAGFLRIAHEIQNAYEYTARLPLDQQESAREELLVLMCLLRPTKYRHLATYLRIQHPA